MGSPSNKASWSWKRFFKEWVLTIAVAFTIAFLFRTTIASPRHIPTGSMIPTIQIGEFIFVSMFAYNWFIPFTRTPLIERRDPERGEVIVFEYPQDPSKDYIKRVIAVPGDTVEVRDKRVIVNGSPLPLEPIEEDHMVERLEPRYNPENVQLYREKNGEYEYTVAHLSHRPSRDVPRFRVPPDSFYVMGDNRDDSLDSRSWGPVSREKLLGRGSFIWFSFDRYNFPFIRASRLFTFLH